MCRTVPGDCCLDDASVEADKVSSNALSIRYVGVLVLGVQDSLLIARSF